MFNTLFDSFSICLQGTIFERRPRRAVLNKSAESAWSYDVSAGSKAPPYVLTNEEWKIKDDILTKWHSVANGLQELRQEDRRGRAKWFIELYQQFYSPKRAVPPDPKIEVYYKTLGLNLARDPHVTLTGLTR